MQQILRAQIGRLPDEFLTDDAGKLLARAGISYGNVGSALCALEQQGIVRKVGRMGQNMTWRKSDAKLLPDYKAQRDELLAACETIVSVYETDGMEGMGVRDKVFYETCKAAIAKAKPSA
jgi:hypothetical protein